MSAMLQSGWLDQHPECRLCVHAWPEHCDDAVKKRLSRSNSQFVQVTRKVAGRCLDNGGKTPDMVRSRPDNGSLPEPNPLSAAETAAACDLAAETFDLSDKEREEAWSKTNGTPKKSPPAPDVETVLEPNFPRRIHARHPAVRRCGITEVKKQLRAIMRRTSSGKRVELLHRIDQNHAAWCSWPEWQKRMANTPRGFRTGSRRQKSAGTNLHRAPLAWAVIMHSRRNS